MQHFDSRPPIDILRDVFLLRKRKNMGEFIELPMVTVMFHNRQSISGFVMDFKLMTGNVYNFSIELKDSRDLAFFETHYIQSVVIHDIHFVDYLLSEVTAENADGKKSVTRLEIKSKLANDSKMLSDWFQKKIEIQIGGEFADPKEYSIISQLITDIAMSLRMIGDEEPGKSAISESIDTVVLQKGIAPQIEMVDKALNITETFARSYSTNIRRANLQIAITEVL